MGAHKWLSPNPAPKRKYHPATHSNTFDIHIHPSATPGTTLPPNGAIKAGECLFNCVCYGVGMSMFGRPTHSQMGGGQWVVTGGW